MVDSNYEILCSDNSGSALGQHPTANYAAGLDDTEKQAIINQHCLISYMLGLLIKKSLTTDDKRKLRYFRYIYTFNTQYDGAAMFFFIVKMVQPDKHSGFSDIKSKTKNMNMSHFKHEIPKANLQIEVWMNGISIDRETYLEIVSQQFNLYSTSSCPLFKDYMDKQRSEWEEDKEFKADQVSTMALNKYNKLLTLGRWSKKYPKDFQILYLVRVVQNLVD